MKQALSVTLLFFFSIFLFKTMAAVGHRPVHSGSLSTELPNDFSGRYPETSWKLGTRHARALASFKPDEPHEGRGTVSIIAHGGLPRIAPYNTLTSFRKAIELGVDMLEVDVQQTKDGDLIVLHDKTVDRTTDGHGAVRNFTLAELKSLDAGIGFGEEFRNERIPTLEEVVGILDPRTILLLEIKHGSPYYQGIEERLIEFIREHQLKERVLVKSFDRKAIRRIQAQAPDIPVGISILLRIPLLSLVIHRGIKFENVFDEQLDFLHVHRIGLTQRLVNLAHARGMKIIVWSVNAERDMRKFIAMGVDAIETDESELLKGIRPKGPVKRIGKRSF
jgi:glycerophosphoryl diester phosphodiesterase